MEVKMGMGRSEISEGGKRGEILQRGLLYVDDLVMCDESEEDLRAMVECFVEVRRRGLRINKGKIKVMC